ncbi:unnamed protein product [Hydatigera taeniaeformis]|uniref:Protein kinase domain-containing protein n=1 Tax=Hydatigena taeniaeformis TaxID=6205 RepID=A0A0R3XA10_HYDTA|nr:unnamed protein product [Hydatigera taeniaeformis]
MAAGMPIALSLPLERPRSDANSLSKRAHCSDLHLYVLGARLFGSWLNGAFKDAIMTLNVAIPVSRRLIIAQIESINLATTSIAQSISHPVILKCLIFALNNGVEMNVGRPLDGAIQINVTQTVNVL